MRAQIQTVSIDELIDAKENIAPLLPLELLGAPVHRFDLSKDTIKHFDASHPPKLESHIQEALQKHSARWGYGGWGEHRAFYESHNTDNHKRVIHLGVDIWVPAGTPVYAPFSGSVHSFKQNRHARGNGPTIITEHLLGAVPLWILFGNLSKDSLQGLQAGQRVRSGDLIGIIGSNEENGGWPSHLHLQLITNIDGYEGAFPAYAKHSEKEIYLQRCPNPESLITPFLIS